VNRSLVLKDAARKDAKAQRTCDFGFEEARNSAISETLAESDL